MKTKTTILTLLNIKKDEIRLIKLPFIYSFFSGAALAFFVTSATSLFLSEFERDDLSLVFILAGFLVLFTGRIYSFFQKRLSFSKVLTGSMGVFLLSIITFVLLYFLLNPYTIIFILYAWIRIFAYIQAVSFWGLAGRLFSLQQGKRLFGLITGGEVIAGIISFFSVPVLLLFIETEHILFLSIGFLSAAFFVLLAAVKKFNVEIKDKPKKENKTETINKNVKLPLKKYFRLFFFIAFLPILAQFFVEFIFQIQAKIEFPQRESLTAFVGIFFGFSSIVEFVLKTFISGKLMSKYGIKIGLLSFPVVVGISFFLASTVGIIYGAISFFFSFVALGRLFTRAVRTSMYDPAAQILYQPLPVEERLAFQNKIESGPKAYASIIAGVLLFALAKIPGFTLVYFSVFLLIIIIFWLKIVFDMHAEYKEVLQNILQNKEDTSEKGKTLLELIQNKIFLADSVAKQKILSIIKYIQPVNKPDDNITEETHKLKLSEIIEYSQSEKPEKREIAAKLFANYKIYKIDKHLIRLLSDTDFDVRNQAIITAGQLKEQELFSHLSANLQIPEYRELTYKIIINIGEKTLDSLAELFQKIEYRPEIQYKIIDAFKNIESNVSQNFLRRWINHPDENISFRVIEALGELNYTASESENTIINLKIEKEIKNFAYLSSCIVDLNSDNLSEKIRQMLEESRAEKMKKIFSMLSAIYDYKAMTLIFDNLNKENAEADGFAMEIADNVLAEIHKKMLFPILESNIFDLIKNIRTNYAVEQLSVTERLHDIINTDINTCNEFIKAEAINISAIYKNENCIKILKSNIIHPNIIIRETAALALYNISQQIFFDIISLYSKTYPEISNLAEKINIESDKRTFMAIEKIKMLKSLEIFSQVPENKLISIAHKSSEIILSYEKEIFFDKENKYDIYILLSGVLKNKHDSTIIEEGAILRYDKLLKYGRQIFVAEETSLLIKSQLYLLNNIINSDLSFSEKFLDSVTGNKN